MENNEKLEEKFDIESCKPSENARINYCILYEDKRCPKTCEYAQIREKDKINKL